MGEIGVKLNGIGVASLYTTCILFDDNHVLNDDTPVAEINSPIYILRFFPLLI